MTTGTKLIADERDRQIEKEGWTAAHDDTTGHQNGEMIDAALSYIRAAINYDHPAMRNPPKEWPWERQWWKPAPTPLRNLVKAGALIAAEIDRLIRAQH